MRGVFAVFLGTGLNAGIKTMIFNISGGQGPFWVPPGVAGGDKIRNFSVLTQEGM